ncbi:hypothetical protein [Pseudocitrobacter corydidari]|uniref:DUF3828 domain-containing protein n=1 Tax=Pseudocitrobacter corydidari TaxID=2891570 RepID=A0ABY3S5W3_9ENTR|nr:hypothetical protein [Pseudocitrobacter corydidari]UGS41479.1 hypothetical protein G163CM_21950 [Pseudocitrobacter corydidari]
MEWFYSLFCRVGLILFIGVMSVPVLAESTLTAKDEQQIRQLMFRWNDALNKTPDAQPQFLYSSKVMWYGRSLSIQQVLAQEQAYLAKNKGYFQEIISTLNIHPVEQADNLFEVSFVKRAGLTLDTSKNYPQEMRVVKEAQGWRIVSETDGITRANQSKEERTDIARGKFDGQKLSYVWMTEEDPRTGKACQPYNACDCALWSSDFWVQPVKIPRCLANTVETLSHLDDSGRDRVVVSPEWWSSNSRLVHVYDIQQGQWIRVLPVIDKNLNIQEAVRAADIVQRSAEHPGQVNVTRAVWDEENEVTKTEVVTQTLWELK